MKTLAELVNKKRFFKDGGTGDTLSTIITESFTQTKDGTVAEFKKAKTMARINSTLLLSPQMKRIASIKNSSTFKDPHLALLEAFDFNIEDIRLRLSHLR